VEVWRGAKLLVVAEELLSSVPDAGSLGDVGEVIVIADSDSGATARGDGALAIRPYEEFR
jgi:hypothetical protein